MKIAYDYQTFTLQAYGGISRYYFKLTEELTKSGEEVKIFAPYHCNQLIDTLDKSIAEGKKIASKDFSKPKALVLMMLNQLLSKNAIHHWKPDIVHETYFSIRRSAPRKYPVVVSVYDMIHEKFPQYFHKADPTSFLKRLAIKRADHIICISESTKRDLINLFPFVEDKVSVIHLGFSSFKPKEQDVEIMRPYFLYVGSRNGHKNFVNLLSSFASSEKLRSDFDLMAFGGGEFSVNENKLIDELGFRPHQIKQVGGDDNTLAMYYKKATAFVYPSYYEGFGLPPLEAMAQDCPVVSSNSSSMPEVIGDAAEFFDPYSIGEMAAAIEKVAFSSSRRDDLIEKGKTRLGVFSWNKCANETLRIYEQLI